MCRTAQNPKPSWNGESVGRYEGDTLVVDTIGQTTKSFVDLFRTPHSEQLHVIERYRLIEGGKALQVEMTIEDPVAFVKPWKVTKRWEKVTTQPRRWRMSPAPTTKKSVAWTARWSIRSITMRREAGAAADRKQG